MQSSHQVSGLPHLTLQHLPHLTSSRPASLTPFQVHWPPCHSRLHQAHSWLFLFKSFEDFRNNIWVGRYKIHVLIWRVSYERFFFLPAVSFLDLFKPLTFIAKGLDPLSWDLLDSVPNTLRSIKTLPGYYNWQINNNIITTLLSW